MKKNIVKLLEPTTLIVDGECKTVRWIDDLNTFLLTYINGKLCVIYPLKVDNPVSVPFPIKETEEELKTKGIKYKIIKT